LSGAILHFGYTCLPSTVGATEKLAISLCAMSDDLAAAVIADWGKLMNRAFEAIESMTITGCCNVEG
jgi:hypothetical protein